MCHTRTYGINHFAKEWALPLPDARCTLQVFLEVMNSVLMTGEIPGLFAKDEMMAMTADLRNSFLKVRRLREVRAPCLFNYS